MLYEVIIHPSDVLIFRRNTASLCDMLLPNSGVTVGFVLVDLSVQEGDGTVAGCMEIKNAESVILEQPIEVTMSSFSCGLALGTKQNECWLQLAIVLPHSALHDTYAHAHTHIHRHAHKQHTHTHTLGCSMCSW